MKNETKVRCECGIIFSDSIAGCEAFDLPSNMFRVVYVDAKHRASVHAMIGQAAGYVWRLRVTADCLDAIERDCAKEIIFSKIPPNKF